MITEEGKLTATSLRSTDSLVMKNTSSVHHQHKGKCLSVNRYKKSTGKMPKPHEIITKKTRAGKVKEFVKIYDHDDSSEWSFIKSEAEQVEKEHVLDDGGLVLDADQLGDHYDHASAVIQDAPSSSKAPDAASQSTQSPIGHDSRMMQASDYKSRMSQ